MQVFEAGAQMGVASADIHIDLVVGCKVQAIEQQGFGVCIALVHSICVNHINGAKADAIEL